MDGPRKAAWETALSRLSALLCEPSARPDDIAQAAIAVVDAGARDESVGDALCARWVDKRCPPALRFMIPSLLACLPSGRERLHLLILHANAAEELEVCGLLEALQGDAPNRGSDERFWSGFILANAHHWGSDARERWMKAIYGNPLALSSGTPTHFPGYSEHMHLVSDPQVIEWLTNGFGGENRLSIVRELFGIVERSDSNDGSLELAVTIYRRTSDDNVRIAALGAMSRFQGDVAEGIFRQELASAHDSQRLKSVLCSRAIRTSRDPSLVPTILDKARQLEDDGLSESLVWALANKDVHEAYDFLFTLFQGARGGRDYRTVILQALPPSGTCPIVRGRIRELVELGAQAPETYIREQAYRTMVRSFPQDSRAFLERVLATEDDPTLVAWARAELGN